MMGYANENHKFSSSNLDSKSQMSMPEGGGQGGMAAQRERSVRKRNRNESKNGSVSVNRQLSSNEKPANVYDSIRPGRQSSRGNGMRRLGSDVSPTPSANQPRHTTNSSNTRNNNPTNSIS